MYALHDELAVLAGQLLRELQSGVDHLFVIFAHDFGHHRQLLCFHIASQSLAHDFTVRNVRNLRNGLQIAVRLLLFLFARYDVRVKGQKSRLVSV